jgi:hypothetical protein
MPDNTEENFRKVDMVLDVSQGYKYVYSPRTKHLISASLQPSFQLHSFP